MLSTCSVSEKGNPRTSGSVDAQRFNLAEVSNNKWRVAMGRADVGETESFYTRREMPSNGHLLIRSELTGTIFSYDPETRQLGLSNEQKWNGSTDKIAECRGSWVGVVDVDQEQEYKAVLWKTWRDISIQTTVDISGRHQLGDMLISPTQTKLAVFSFDGPYKRGNFILFGAGESIKGDRHIDFFEIVKLPEVGATDRRPEVRSLGQTVTIKDPPENLSMQPCWTPDEKFIVIPTSSSPWLWIVDAKV